MMIMLHKKHIKDKMLLENDLYDKHFNIFIVRMYMDIINKTVRHRINLNDQ